MRSVKPDERRLPWDRLSDSAKTHVAYIAALLAADFTGTMELECVQGGVRNFRETKQPRSADMESLLREVS